ncbi:MAG: acetyl-CoA carboxylase biotin carboxylase subunit [Oscillospiraceae bacterium]
MFKKILVANRGEIAVRIIRACRELGVRTVAVCSQADKLALHAQIADETICIGPASSKDSYLNIHSILSACEITGADAIHPGFGFLSENAEFARMCQKCDIKFIGPSPEAMDLMGDKATAKITMQKAGVPVVPGSQGIVETIEQATKVCNEIGFPVLVKASAGGGGRGIRLVNALEELESAMIGAKQEALLFFGYDGVYIEKFVQNPRHIEIQLLADEFGTAVHLGERDCSIQRRNQKMVEESPSPFIQMTDELRAAMGKAAVDAAHAVGYFNAGTIEFLVDIHGKFYFMEMNTRIQVEHPVTEFVTGIDIVAHQILIASGEKLGFTQDDVKLTGHAIECRINAENPVYDFRPSPGTITYLHMPGGPGIRIDSAIYYGYTIPSHYDSMLAKLIVYAPTRELALRKMCCALSEFLIQGVDTNIEFQLAILRNDEFKSGDYNIGFMEKNLQILLDELKN